MSTEVFHRYEKKYLITKGQYERIREFLADKMEPDKYNREGKPYTISNIYFDTKEEHLIRTSIEKPEYKEKIRLRSYGKVSEEDKVFLEIKKKNQGLGNKRRTVMTLKEAKEYLLKGHIPSGRTSNEQILREIEYLRVRDNLVPKVYLAYDRFAFFEKGRGKEGMRITFDFNVRARRTDLSLEEESYGEALVSPGMYLMEIKVVDSIPLWLAHFLSQEKIYSTSFSKYGKEYQEYCQSEKCFKKEKEEEKNYVYINFGSSRNRKCVNG